MKKISYIIYQLLYSAGSVLSRLTNLVFFGGSFHQTLSARAYVEAEIEPSENGWDRRRRLINMLFFWEEDHCEAAWLSEVERAQKTLRLNGML